METVLYNKIKAKAKELCDDYNELRCKYCDAISSLKTDENIVKIFYLESLLKEKNHINCSLAVHRGFTFEKKDLNIADLDNYPELFENGLDETVGTKELFASENYCELENKITDAKNEISSIFKEKSDSIDKLFDVYGNVNFELIRAAFTLGCEYKQFGKILMDTHI